MLNYTDQLDACQDCSLWQSASRPVPGEGPEDAKVCLLGEGPGYYEDQRGRPFIGPAGRVLEGVLRECGLKRHEVYITNLVRHRPEKNRTPIPEEVHACSRWLDLELSALTDLKLIVCLGAAAATKYFPEKAPLGSLRMLPSGVVVCSTYHPAFVLHAKRPAIRLTIRQAILEGLSLI